MIISLVLPLAIQGFEIPAAGPPRILDGIFSLEKLNVRVRTQHGNCHVSVAAATVKNEKRARKDSITDNAEAASATRG